MYTVWPVCGHLNITLVCVLFEHQIPKLIPLCSYNSHHSGILPVSLWPYSVHRCWFNFILVLFCFLNTFFLTCSVYTPYSFSFLECLLLKTNYYMV